MPKKKNDYGLSDFVPDRKSTFISDTEFAEQEEFKELIEEEQLTPKLANKIREVVEEIQETDEELADQV